MEWLADPQIWLSLLTLTALEIVLGIDNIIVISILAAKVKPELQARTRRLGLLFALVTRLALLMAIAWLIGLTKPLFYVMDFAVSGKDLIMIFGGLFLIAKSTHEIHNELEGGGPTEVAKRQVAHASAFGVILQIAAMDIIFSLDSVITAVGMAKHIPVMVAAVIISMAIMLWLATPIAEFVKTHPTVKMLALSFLILIGVLLVADGFGQHIPKGYIYFAMAFSVCVELLNIRIRRKHIHAAP